MTILFRFAAVLVIVPALLHAVSPRSISDFRFENLENFEFSNVSFVENGGVELARETRLLAEDPDILWDLAEWKDGFLVASGQNATLSLISGGRRAAVYTDSNAVIFSDILVTGKSVLLAAVPEATVHRLDENFRPVQKVRLTNRYVWEIVPAPGGYYLLAGDPAALYYMNEKGVLEWSAPVPGENHLLKGVFFRGILYLIGEGNALYRLNTGKEPGITAVHSFDNSPSDIATDGKRLWISVSPKEVLKPAAGSPARQDEDAQSSRTARPLRLSGLRSSVFAFSPDGTAEEIFRRSNIRFLSLSVRDGALVVGTDKNAGYFEIDPDAARPARFTSLGDGKFFRFLNVTGRTYAVLLDPSRILEVGENLSRRGRFRSSPFDTGGFSRWGRPDADFSIVPDTGVRIRSRSGAVMTEDLWGGWTESGSGTVPAPARFYQYEVELSSAQGKQSPVFRYFSVPFFQNNTSPVIDRVIVQSGSAAGNWKITWEARDEDKDTLIYRVYLSRTEKNWILLNDKPLEDASFEFSMDQFPDGIYRVRIEASDERSNPMAESRKAFRVSEPFPIDNTPPEIGEIRLTRKGGVTTARWTASDSGSLLGDASYCVNGGKWIRIIPVDGLFDSRSKTFEASIEEKTPFLLQVQVTDALGNSAVKGLSVPE